MAKKQEIVGTHIWAVDVKIGSLNSHTYLISTEKYSAFDAAAKSEEYLKSLEFDLHDLAIRSIEYEGHIDA